MLKKISYFIIFLLIAGLIGFLIAASTRVSMNFDVAHHLISYQNLFYGKGFVHDYDGKIVYFNPSITTGPELYLPAFLIWKLTGNVDYYAAIYVLIFYYFIFLILATFLIFKKNSSRLIFLVTFLTLFFLNGNFFDDSEGAQVRLFIDPLGEVLAMFFVFFGFYFLHKKKLFFGFLLLGFALDIKTNFLPALALALLLFILVRYFIPIFRDKGLKQGLGRLIVVGALSLLVLAPNLAYGEFLPRLVLKGDEQISWQKERIDLINFQRNFGFGTVRNLIHNPNQKGLMEYKQSLIGKVTFLRKFFNKSDLSIILFFTSLLILIIASAGRHFSFYLFLFAAITAGWWFFASFNPWYRYFFPVELAYILGTASLLPYLIKKREKFLAIMISAFSLAVFYNKFSLIAFKNTFDNTQMKNLMLMKEEVAKIDGDKIFTHGWFQDPQMMLLTNKRFHSYWNESYLAEAKVKAKAESEELYFLAGPETYIEDSAKENIMPYLELKKEFGANKLYRIKF